MTGTFNVILLNAIENQKRNSKDNYYTISFLDEKDNSFNAFINYDIYTKIKEYGFKRFSEITIELSIYKENDGNRYNFSIKDVVPFQQKVDK